MLKHLPHFFSVPVSRRDEKKQTEKVFCKPVDLVKIVRCSRHPPQHHHRPPQHHSPFQSILEFSSFLHFLFKFLPHELLQDFHMEKFSLQGRIDGQGPVPVYTLHVEQLGSHTHPTSQQYFKWQNWHWVTFSQSL